MSKRDPNFESRKKDHIEQSLNKENQLGLSPSDQIQLGHKAFPEINFDEVSLETEVFAGIKLAAPIFVSSMTAGHDESTKINGTLAKACANKNWLFAVGSQRKELFDSQASEEWLAIKQEHPKLQLVGNIGLSQLIEVGPKKVLELIKNLSAKAFFIHTNPLQEALQKEGTPKFKNAYSCLEELCEMSPVPILVKETGCGFDSKTLEKLFSLPKLYAVDVSGAGGTHWGRIEGQRALNSQKENQSEKELKKNEILYQAAMTYQNWGITTAESLALCQELNQSGHQKKYWASGGVRSGLDILTCLSMGAELVGLAQPLLRKALESEDALMDFMNLLEFETKVGLFCSGFRTVQACRQEAEWQWKI